MKKFLSLIAVALFISVFASGCGDTHAGPEVTLTITPGLAKLDAGDTATFRVTSANDPSFVGVTWTLTGGGTLTNNSPYLVQYNTPTTSTSGELTATSMSNPNVTATVAITVDADPKINSASLPTGILGDAYKGSWAESGGVAPLTWMVTSGSLPAGLSLNSGTGVISGTPVTDGTSSFTVNVTDSSTPPSTFIWPSTITIVSALAITPITFPSASIGSVYSVLPSAKGGVLPYTWSIASGSLPSGVTLNSATGAISGLPTATGNDAFTLQVADSSTPAQTAMFSTSIAVQQGSGLLTIPTQAPPDATIGLAYSVTLTATGGTTPYTWAIASGSLPAGLSLNSSTGVISGSALAAATSNFTVKVTDSSSPAQTASASLALRVDAAFSIGVSSLPTALKSVAYTTTLTATGAVGPTTWSISNGSLPNGLTLDANTGVISGTPSATGTASFTLQCTDSANPPRTATQAVSLLVNSQLSLSLPSLPNGTVGISFSTTPNVSGGTAPLTWSVSAGTLPAGLSLNATTGAITGVPSTIGSSNFTLQAKDSSAPPQIATVSVTIVINAALSLTAPVLPNAIANILYSTTLNATGAVAPLTWSIVSGSLPSGLSLNATTGVISGTPSITGAASFKVQVTDSAVPPRTASAQVTLIVVGGLSLTGGVLPSAVDGLPYLDIPLLTGGTAPFTWSISAGSLPPGLMLNPTTGAITGTPTATGTFSFTLHITDSSVPAQSVNIPSSITVNALLSLSFTGLPDAIAGVPYIAPLVATGGVAPYTWSVTTGTLPTGLNLNGTTGVISGTATTAGSYSFTLQVADSANPVQTKAFPTSIRVDAALTISPITLPIGVVGLPFSASITASGGVAPLAFSVTAGTLPSGLSLNATTGVISGTPLSVLAASALTVQVEDSSNPAQVKTVSLTAQVNAALAITTTTLPNAISSLLYNTTLTATGGSGGISWSLTNGALPLGLSLNASTGAISGTTTALGLAGFTVQAKDSSTPPQTKSLSVSIFVNPVLAITSTTLPNAILSILYSTTLTATGGSGPITWSVSVGSLPSGLTLNASTGVISGTSLLAGTANLTVTATDSSAPPQVKSLAVSILTNTALTIPAITLPNAVLGNLYNTSLSATGGVAPITWSVSAGTLPLGLSLSSTGVLSGTPTALGTASFTIQAKDSSNPPQIKTSMLNLVTNPLLSIVSSTLPDAVVGVLYNTTVSAAGGVAPIKWAVSGGTLPTGLALNASTGVLSGTASTAANGSVILQAMDSSNPPQVQTVSLNLSIFTKLAINPILLPPGLLSTLFDATLSATGGDAPFTWSVSSGALPAGVTLDPTTGLLSGTPIGLGSFSFTIQVQDSATPAQTATLSLGLNITSPGVNNSLLSGGYAFMFQGSNASGPVAIVGSFQADGAGTITTGVLDLSQSSGVTQSVVITGGDFILNADNRGTLAITTSTLGTQNFRFALDAAGGLGRLVEFDAAGPLTIRGNGVIKKQNPAAFSDSNISSVLAFGFSGNTLAGGRSAMIGSVVTNSAGKINSGLVDVNSAGTVTADKAVLTTSTYSISGASTGRGTLALSATGVRNVNGVVYVVSASDLFFLRTDAFASGVDMLSGEILGQSNGPYGILPLGTSVLHLQGSSTSTSTSVGAGLVISTGLGILTGTLDANVNGVPASNLAITGGTSSISSPSAGRGSITFAGSTETLYYVNSSQAFVMDASGASVRTGMLEAQIGFPLTLLNLTANYVSGTEAVANSGITYQSGVEAITPLTGLTGSIAGTFDTNGAGDSLTIGNLLSLNLSLATNGRVTAGNTVYYVVSSSRVIAVEVGSGQTEARILVADQ